MASNERLKELREMGVKAATFNEHGAVVSVEFFPRSLLDVDDIVPGMDAPTDRPPPPATDEDGPPNALPPAMARILKRGSVS